MFPSPSGTEIAHQMFFAILVDSTNDWIVVCRDPMVVPQWAPRHVLANSAASSRAGFPSVHPRTILRLSRTSSHPTIDRCACSFPFSFIPFFQGETVRFRFPKVRSQKTKTNSSKTKTNFCPKRTFKTKTKSLSPCFRKWWNFKVFKILWRVFL